MKAVILGMAVGLGIVTPAVSQNSYTYNVPTCHWLSSKTNEEGYCGATTVEVHHATNIYLNIKCYDDDKKEYTKPLQEPDLTKCSSAAAKLTCNANKSNDWHYDGTTLVQRCGWGGKPNSNQHETIKCNITCYDGP
ncbi:hypothetical protein [Bauldia sp.]|uniref:hypothetical protein n=1 Tax=Bauldia sp. TaxID=2575872 RepID=UPI003BA9B469